MTNRGLLKAGIAGSVIAALCCFTPVLWILLGILGLSAWVGWLDYVVLPALAVFVGITIYALWQVRTDASRRAAELARDPEAEA